MKIKDLEKTLEKYKQGEISIKEVVYIIYGQCAIDIAKEIKKLPKPLQWNEQSWEEAKRDIIEML